MRQWSDEEILDSIREWAAQHEGRPPGFNHWRSTKGVWPNSWTVRTRFGSWAEAVERAGFPRPPSVTPPTFSHEEAVRLRDAGLNNVEISEQLGVHPTTIGKFFGTTPRPPKNPMRRTRAERIADLQAALAKEADEA